MLDTINFHHLYYFWVIATEGSIAKACKKLRLAQPTLSAQLKTFENKLGHTLFERRNRRLILTQMGKVTLDYADQIFMLAKEFEWKIRVISDVLPRKVTIGILASLSKFTIHQLLQKIMKRERIFVTLKEGNMDILQSELEQGSLDLILSDRPCDSLPSGATNSKMVKDIDIHMVGNENHMRLKNNFPESLNEVPMILFTTASQVRADMDHFFKLNNIQPKVLGEIEDVALLRQFALSGTAVVPLPKEAIEDDLKNKTLFSIGQLPRVRAALWAITSKKRQQDILLDQFLVSAQD